ncbi:CsbD family protein [Brachybacterium sp. JHP9]|uniref:CsbD family protein n=1 Tax=Brachybacterium equifaecis TaxID=2910770 RepID=A0ABT0QY84_9MICO|nr:CsbD family protein [Brachybacterium equifaecis]MCL6422163.1 CsbD family protein [Brachybacterium equifaecis]
MNLQDDIENKTQELGGKAKEFIGEKTGDRELEAEGAGDKAEAGVKQAIENGKDALKNISDGFTKN